jgi:hypothetical protein
MTPASRTLARCLRRCNFLRALAFSILWPDLFLLARSDEI